MRNKKIEELFASIEAGDCTNIEQQNSQHLTQVKSLLDGHLAQQRNILNEYKNEYKTISKEINALKGEMTKDRKLLQKSLNQHETLIDRITSYQEGVYMSRRVYNWYLGIFACSVIIVTALITMGIFVWMKNN
jgi:uncharacterized protein YaaN involved in tellurite resistance